MAHMLQIVAQVTHQDARDGHLQPYELVRGEPATINVVVTNIADKQFPGGSISSAEIRFEGGGLSRYTVFEDQLPQLNPSQEYVFMDPIR